MSTVPARVLSASAERQALRLLALAEAVEAAALARRPWVRQPSEAGLAALALLAVSAERSLPAALAARPVRAVETPAQPVFQAAVLADYLFRLPLFNTRKE